MPLPLKFSQLTILTLALFVSSLSGRASAQATGIADLPDCAADCVRTSATAANCALTDVPCLCSTGFSPAVQQCAIPVCGFGDRSTISGVLREMCESQTTTSQPPTTSASSPSPTPTPNPGPAPSASSTTTITSTTTPPSPATTGTGTTSSAGGPSPSTTLGIGGGVGGGVSGRSSTATSASEGSTTVVVATVVLPQTSALGGALNSNVDDGRLYDSTLWPSPLVRPEYPDGRRSCSVFLDLSSRSLYPHPPPLQPPTFIVALTLTCIRAVADIPPLHVLVCILPTPPLVVVVVDIDIDHSKSVPHPFRSSLFTLRFLLPPPLGLSSFIVYLPASIPPTYPY
ncbi:unnamed protein product [Cyclocybe aegerita]|uniref:CFEM domain-containing protein n=1 Tax=Cyclocybe aegerita TaxID=1973307 RepID=A0A8S0VV04_CYCAE|nr:unnamed protein product [Cyclocybe aegerita]